MKKLLFILLISVGSIQAQTVYVDNQTNCYYILGLEKNNCTAILSNGPLDVPPNTQLSTSLSSFGLASVSQIMEIFLKNTTPATPTSESVLICANSPIYTFSIHVCDTNPVKINWWISGSDFYIEITI